MHIEQDTRNVWLLDAISPPFPIIHDCNVRKAHLIQNTKQHLLIHHLVWHTRLGRDSENTPGVCTSWAISIAHRCIVRYSLPYRQTHGLVMTPATWRLDTIQSLINIAEVKLAWKGNPSRHGLSSSLSTHDRNSRITFVKVPIWNMKQRSNGCNFGFCIWSHLEPLRTQRLLSSTLDSLRSVSVTIHLLVWALGSCHEFK